MGLFLDALMSELVCDFHLIILLVVQFLITVKRLWELCFHTYYIISSQAIPELVQTW